MAHPIFDPIREAAMEPMAKLGAIATNRKESKLIVANYWTMPNHPAAKAINCHYAVSIQNIISCGIPYERYWQMFAQVLHLGKKSPCPDSL